MAVSVIAAAAAEAAVPVAEGSDAVTLVLAKEVILKKLEESERQLPLSSMSLHILAKSAHEDTSPSWILGKSAVSLSVSTPLLLMDSAPDLGVGLVFGSESPKTNG